MKQRCVARAGEGGTVTSQVYIVLSSLSLSFSLSLLLGLFLFRPPSIRLPLFFLFTANSTEICTLLSKYIQSNLITAITFLLGWLTVLPVPLNAAVLLLYIPKLLIPPHPSCTFTGALAHPSISLLFSLTFSSFLSFFSSCFLFLVFLFYSPGYIGYLVSSHFFSGLLSELLFSYLLILLLAFHLQPLGSFFTSVIYSYSFSKANRIAGFLTSPELFAAFFFFLRISTLLQEICVPRNSNLDVLQLAIFHAFISSIHRSLHARRLRFMMLLPVHKCRQAASMCFSRFTILKYKFFLPELECVEIFSICTTQPWWWHSKFNIGLMWRSLQGKK